MNVYAKHTGHKSLIIDALTYLPPSKSQKVNRFISYIVSMFGNNGCCFDLTHKRVIYISEEIIPDEGIAQGSLYYRWFVYTVLHECAHGILKHKVAPEGDPRRLRQEKQAQRLALLWLNYSERAKMVPETLWSELLEVHDKVEEIRKEIRKVIDTKLKPLARPLFPPDKKK